MNSYRKISLTVLALLVVGLSGLKPALAQKVQVNSADPASAAQGTVNLDVKISGKGFDSSAQVRFLVTTTTDPGGITVNSVKVRGSKKLIVNIDIDLEAEVDDFDVEVEMLGGRKGKGTTLFAVSATGSGTDFHLHAVTITGDVSGGGENWEEESANDWVLFKHFYPPEATGSFDLSYFLVPADQGGPFTGGRGENCFGTGIVPRLFQVILSEKRRTGANAAFWITAYTDDGLTEVVYRLELSGGTFDHPDDWPPLAWNSMEMPSWTLSLDNGGKKIKNISCLGTGNFVSPIVIDVLRTE